jgi:hypothetical protein
MPTRPSLPTQPSCQFQRTIDNRNWIEMGTDPLAMTRNNTAALLNMTPVHARAGQLVLIRRWIAMQIDLLDRLAAHLRIVRIRGQQRRWPARSARATPDQR